MKVKSLFITIVLNVFLMLFASVLLEYINLSERFTALENTVQVALDSSIGVATGSEEMFTDEFQRYVSSFASDDSNRVTYSTTLLWRGNKFHQVNSYALSYFYKEHGRLPINANELVHMSYGGSDQLKFYFEWLYGSAGADYTNEDLQWANRNNELIRAYNNISPRGDSRNENFYNYYKKVGIHQKTVGYLKERSDESAYKLTLKEYPNLINMGFEWMHEYNSVNSDFTADNFTSTVKMGKSYGNNNNTQYYLTPMSLGVTYVPIEILKPCMLANLETLVRLNRLASGNTFNNANEADKSDFLDTLNSANECVETSVYVGGNQHREHVHTDGENIITDGQIEYDLSTVQTKVDYFFVDFGDSNRSRNQVLLSKVHGCISYAEYKNYSQASVAYGVGGANTQSNLRKVTLDHWREQDSVLNNPDGAYVDKYKAVKDGRVIARVSVKLKVHVPYQSSIMQWMCERSGNRGHFGIKMYNPSTGRVERSKDGVWYSYTTYFMQSRS